MTPSDGRAEAGDEGEAAAMAARLLASRAAGDFAPAWLNGAIDLHQALRLQLAVLDEELAAGRTVGGWKVGLTSAASRAKLGADERPFGFVPSDRVLGSGTQLRAGAVRGLSIEAEMCFTIGSAITDAAITADRILHHVASVSAGFELNEQRPGSVRPDFPAMVTDCLTNWGIVAGTGRPATSASDLLNTTITMYRGDEELFRGLSADHCDDHTISLCRLVQQLALHDRRLEAGDRVITGAFARFPAEAGDRWRAEFSGPGFPTPSTVELTVT